MQSALCKTLLVAVAMACCYLSAYGQCVDADCDPPAIVAANVVINVPWTAGGGAGCFLQVNITTRICPGGRCEVFFNSIERSACCSEAFVTASGAAVVQAVRDWLFANPPIGNPPCAVLRIVHPKCWTKDNVAGTMTPCADPPCCYIQGPIGGPPGPVTTLGAGVCVLPCIPVCP